MIVLLIFLRQVSECTRWPAGTYGLPKPISGCPWSEGFSWREGWRSQDTNGKQSNNSRSPKFHLDGKVDNDEIKRSFCIKDDITTDRNRPLWPKGKYCIYKRRRQCPAGLTSGELFWDDEENANRNDDGGTLPEGKYDHDTVIYFCCKTNGSKDDPIALPMLEREIISQGESPIWSLQYLSYFCYLLRESNLFTVKKRDTNNEKETRIADEKLEM
nr:uncharacterized protein LOC131779471 [Pocillopora verrucosa]